MRRWTWVAVVFALLGALPVAGAAPIANESEAETTGDPPGRLEVLGLSLLLPGLGHRVLGQVDRSYAYMGVEAVVWSAFGIFEVQGKVRKDSYVEMAGLFAGVPDAKGRDGDYYRLLGSYRSSEEYDDEVRRDARARSETTCRGAQTTSRAIGFETTRSGPGPP